MNKNCKMQNIRVELPYRIIPIFWHSKLLDGGGRKGVYLQNTFTNYK